MSRRSIIIIAIIIIMIVPFPTTIVPSWRLQVVEDSGKFCPNKEVTETWAHYSIYIGSGGFSSQTLLTDNEGYVDFPGRTVWAPLVWRIVGAVIANALSLAHGSVGPHASVYTTGLKDVAWISFKPNEPLPEKMIVSQCSYNDNY